LQSDIYAQSNRYNFDASVILADYDSFLPNFMFAPRNVCGFSESFLPVANLLKELLILRHKVLERTSVDLQDDEIEYAIQDICTGYRLLSHFHSGL
jgi:hypothetical protein